MGEMKSTKVAVFGHYDSRGGTTAIELPDNPTIDDVMVAFKRYDRELFGIEEAGDKIQSTAYGMEARVCDQMVHEMLYGDDTPAGYDFMFVADLHYDGDIDVCGRDWDDNGYAVLIDTTNEPTGDENDPDTKRGWVEATIKNPVQLEIVEVPVGARSEDAYEAYKQISADLEKEGLHFGGSSRWTPEQYTTVKAAQARVDASEEAANRIVIAAAKVLKGDKIERRRWDDDAYGFLVME